MTEQTSDPGTPEAWGDVQMPEGAQRRQTRRESMPTERPPDSRMTASASPASPGTEGDPTLREDTNEYALGATTLQPGFGQEHLRLPLGPGNEAMEGGSSPAPRGYTGGAMSKFNAGLSPSFESEAEGVPSPGGAKIYSPAEEAATFMRPASAEPSNDTRNDERTAEDTRGAVDEPDGPRGGEGSAGS